MGFRVHALAALCCVLLAPRLDAYSFTGTRWIAPSATFQLQLGPNASPLADGFSSWGASAEDALAIWNAQVALFRFDVVRDSTATRAEGNRVNNVHFSADVYGDAWGSNVLAVTLTYAARNANTETDVLFNNRLKWDSYRGPLRTNATGQPVYDFHRVALHEFGHALGLDHPDENGQSVSALMNSRVGPLDRITTDDIAGAQAIYGAAAATIAAPVITLQPVSRTVTAGQGVVFTVGASSTAPLTYQWFKTGVPIGGATASSYTIATTAAAHAGNYMVVVANSGGSITSQVATLVVNPPPAAPTFPVAPVAPVAPAAPVAPVNVPPTITSQPGDRRPAPGESFTLSVAATGTAPLMYQWRKDGVPIAGANGATYTTARSDASHTGTYLAVVSNQAGTVASASARVLVGTAPSIATQPLSQTVATGVAFELSVLATGSPAPALQWFKDGSPLAGTTHATYRIAAAQLAHEGVYSVTATNSMGSASSASAHVVIVSAPAITTQPLAQTVASGERAQLVVEASGTPAPTYQWLRDGVELGGATSASLVFEAAGPGDNGNYSVRITNAAGSVTSAGARLTVRFSQLVNLSTRAFVPAGGTLTPGFFVRGDRPKPLLIRAVGPTLAAFGVETAIGQAKLDLIAQGTSAAIASNGGWGSTPALSGTFARVGAFPLAADSKDAALHAELAPSGYTVRIGSGDATLEGIMLAEIYDADPSPGSAQLVNVSTLGFVGTGENVLTAGFVISGNAAKRLLIRAVGPALEAFGVTDVLPNPQLGLVPLGGAEPLATNDDWPDLPNLHAAFGAAGAFPFPIGSKDAALVITLQPGAYTVIVSGVSGTATGHALVELYDLDRS